MVSNSIDQGVPLSMLPEQSVGWLGTPGVSGHRAGRDFSSAFVVDDLRLESSDVAIANRLTVSAADAEAGLGLALEVELRTSGLLRTRATLTNLSPTVDYTLDSLILAVPVPMRAQQILDFTGRHLRERSPQRHEFTLGTHVRENRRGRTGADATLLLIAGTTGFSFETGEVWGLHVAWSGNHRTLAERTSAVEGFLGGGELLLPGEGTLEPGATYATDLGLRIVGPWP